jgi:hypothetical protein
MLFERLPRMAAKQIVAKPDKILLEMEEYVKSEAERDADRVALFLRSHGVQGTREKPIALPMSFLLHLGAAMRLHHWEEQGFSLHRTAGLPDAGRAIKAAVQSLTDPGTARTALCESVVRLSLDRFAWHGRRDLEADVALDEMIDDDALDALAEFLWASRHFTNTTDGLQP